MTLSLVAIALSGVSADAIAKSSHRGPAGPQCNDPAVIKQLGAEYRARHSVPDTRLRNIGDAHWNSWPQKLIERRFCRGQIEAPRGPERLIYPIYFAIIADGPTYYVPWCVVGLDRPWIDDERCRLARP